VTITTSVPHLLNVGCGTRFHRDWDNIDLSSADDNVKAHNVLKGLPFPDNSYDGVYCSHFLEHISINDVARMLGEMRRVLKSGGILRVVVPDLEYQSKLYLDCLAKVREAGGVVNEEHYDWAVIALIDQMTRDTFGGKLAAFMTRPDLRDKEFLRTTLAGHDIDEAQASGARQQGTLMTLVKAVVPSSWRAYRKRRAYRRSGEAHKWMWDEFSMSRSLREAKFSQIERQTATKSHIAGFEGFHLDTDEHGSVRKPNSLFMEAIK